MTIELHCIYIVSTMLVIEKVFLSLNRKLYHEKNKKQCHYKEKMKQFLFSSEHS